MVMLLFLTSLVAVSADIDLASLKPRDVVQLVLQDDSSVLGGVVAATADTVEVVDLETQTAQTFSRADLKAIRSNLSERQIVDKVGPGPYVAWQLAPIFENAARRQTIASIQQAAVYVTANRWSGLMVGDEAYVFRLGEPVKDPVTGEILDVPEQKVAKLEVISVSDKLVTCRPTGEFVVPLHVGDLIRPVEPRTTVAVLPFMNSAGQPVRSGLKIADELTNALVNLDVPTLERARTAEILGEQLRQLSGVYEGGDTARVGKLLGAATLITGRLIPSTDKRQLATLSLRLLDVRTGMILKSLELTLSARKLDMTVITKFGQPEAQPDLPFSPRSVGVTVGAAPFSTITNSLGMTFVVIPPGEFTMGSPQSEAARDPGETEHRVTLTQSFGMGSHEVTQAQFEQVVGRNPGRFKGADNPIESINWEEAVEFCRLLSALPTEQAAGRTYRLPTEAEWEYACRAGTTTAYCFGNDDRHLSKYAWYGKSSGGVTHPVGQLQANAWGLHDMHGNVWELCSDWYAPYPVGAVTDPQGPESGTRRVQRGGCFIYSAADTRSARRTSMGQVERSHNLSFRVVLNPAAK